MPNPIDFHPLRLAEIGNGSDPFDSVENVPGATPYGKVSLINFGCIFDLDISTYVAGHEAAEHSSRPIFLTAIPKLHVFIEGQKHFPDGHTSSSEPSFQAVR